MDQETQRFMEAADEVAWDIYRSAHVIIESLNALTDAQRYKQPPLLHLFASVDPRNPSPSPVIYARESHSVSPYLPVHIIVLPHGEIGTAWSLLVLHHEVAHGLVADLRLNLERLVQTQAQDAGLGLERVIY